jgi:hypothetical protein
MASKSTRHRKRPSTQIDSGVDDVSNKENEAQPNTSKKHMVSNEESEPNTQSQPQPQLLNSVQTHYFRQLNAAIDELDVEG